MAAAPRVFKVENDNEITLVIATSANNALNHVVKGQYAVAPATALEVLEYIQAGGEVETSIPPAPQDPGSPDPSSPDSGEGSTAVQAG